MTASHPDVTDLVVTCDTCGAEHAATYDHEGQFNQGAIYAVVCTVDNLVDYYTSERLHPAGAR